MGSWIRFNRYTVLSGLLLIFFLDFCACSEIPVLHKKHAVEKRFSNSTESSTSKLGTKTSESILTIVSASFHPTITAAATLSNAIAPDNSTSTITKAPIWGNQSIPINTCSTITTYEGEPTTLYTPCHVYADTVQLSFFPEPSGNITYPRTYYNPVLSVTMTSPSVYLVVNTIIGYNDCGDLGPKYATKVIPMDLTDIFTLQPYADATVTTRMGEPQQLTLSDLAHCTYSPSSRKGKGRHTSTASIDETRNHHPVNSTYNLCHPRLVFPIQLKRLGYPYWAHCSNSNYRIGLFDPPGAVPSVDSLFTSVADIASTAEPISAAPTPAPDLASSTPSQDQASSTSPFEASPTAIVDQNSQPAQSVATTPSDPVTQPAGSGGVLIQSSNPLVQATTTGIVAVVGTNTISAVAGSSGVILGGTTASIGQVTTLVDSTGGKAIVSVGSSGVFVGGTDSKTTFFANPTQAQSSNAVATIAGQTISAAPGDSTIVINGQTITSGGAEITISGTDNVVTFGSEGLIVKNSGGVVSTFAIPTPTLSFQNGITVAGFEVTETAGASKVVIGTQTATLGGDAITLDNHNVVSVGSSGVVVQYPGGAVSTVSLRSSVLSNASLTPTATNKVAVAIASIIGASNADASSTSISTGETVKATGAANTVKGTGVATLGGVLMAFIFGL